MIIPNPWHNSVPWRETDKPEDFEEFFPPFFFRHCSMVLLNLPDVVSSGAERTNEAELSYYEIVE